jgi:hypothetical protein
LIGESHLRRYNGPGFGIGTGGALSRVADGTELPLGLRLTVLETPLEDAAGVDAGVQHGIALFVSDVLEAGVVGCLEAGTLGVGVELLLEVNGWRIVVVLLGHWLNVAHVYFVKVGAEFDGLFLVTGAATGWLLLLGPAVGDVFLLPHVFGALLLIVVLYGLAHPAGAFRFAFLHHPDLLLGLQVCPDAAEVAVGEERVRAVEGDGAVHDHPQRLLLLQALLQLVLDDPAPGDVAESSCVLLEVHGAVHQLEQTHLLGGLHEAVPLPPALELLLVGLLVALEGGVVVALQVEEGRGRLGLEDDALAHDSAQFETAVVEAEAGLLAAVVLGVLVDFLLQLGQLERLLELRHVVALAVVLGVESDEDLLIAVLEEEDAVVVEQVDGIAQFAVDVQHVDQQLVGLAGGQPEKAVVGISECGLEQAAEEDHEDVHDDGVLPQLVLDLVLVAGVGQREEELNHQLLHLRVAQLRQRTVLHGCQLHVRTVQARLDDVEHVLLNWARVNAGQQREGEGFQVGVGGESEVLHSACLQPLQLLNFSGAGQVLKKGVGIIACGVLSQRKSAHLEQLQLFLLDLLLAQGLHLKLL